MLHKYHTGRDYVNTVHRPADRDVNWTARCKNRHPLCSLKIPLLMAKNSCLAAHLAKHPIADKAEKGSEERNRIYMHAY